MPAQTREPALVDDGIPGGPGVYSTRCPPLPRLRLTESREVVRRAALRAKGVDPDLVERCVTPSAKNKHERTASADGAGDSPVSATAKPSPRAADPLADLVDGADALFDLPEGRKRDRGGGGGGDFSVGARADHHLRTVHDVRRVRAERRALRTLLPGKGKPHSRAHAGGSVRSSSSNPASVKGTCSNVAAYGGNRGADRVLAEERKRVERELNAARTLVRRRECAHNAAVNARVGRERELRALNGELEVAAREAARTNDLGGLDAELDAKRAKVREKQALADEEAETSLRRAHIARRLTASNVELRRGTAALKADLADATADAEACREYERGALDARKRAHDALEWVRARYLERVNAWKRDVAHAKVEHEQLLDALKEEKTKERILARRLERERARSEADCVGAKRATESAREEMTRRESEEEWCRAALRRLASAAGLHDAASLTPAQIFAQLEKSRVTRAAADAQIVEAQERERAAWTTLLAVTEELRAARLGIDDDSYSFDDDSYSFDDDSYAGRSSRARSVFPNRARRATLQPNVPSSTGSPPPFNVRRPSVPGRTSAVAPGTSGARTRRSSVKPPVPKMSRMRAASISAGAAFSPSPKLPPSTATRPSDGKEGPTFGGIVNHRVSASAVGSRRDERLERSIASREKELNAKIRDFNRITSSLATMDEGLKAVDDMVTRVTRVPKRAELRANGESPGVGGGRGGGAAGGVKAVGKNGPTSRMSAPTFASDARAKERDRRRKEQQTSSPALTSLDEEEEEEDGEEDEGNGEVNAKNAKNAPRRRASDLWSAVRRSIPEDSEEVHERDAERAADAADPRAGRLPRRSDAILARYERLPGRLDALLRRISGVMRALPSGRGRRATVVLGAGRSFANGGRGVGPEHFLAGVGHRVGKVPNTVDEVDDDPARMRLKRGRAYREMAMKWCFRAGRPIAGDDDDDDVLVTGDDGLLHFGEGARRESPGAENDEDVRRKKTLAAMASVGLGAAAFRRFVRKERSERVPSRADLKTRSEKAAAKVERARLAAERRRWREEEEERKAAEQDDSD